MKLYYYSCCKFVNFPSCVGIVPESWLKYIALRSKNWINYSICKSVIVLFYRLNKFVRLPSCVGIVPESGLLSRILR